MFKKNKTSSEMSRKQIARDIREDLSLKEQDSVTRFVIMIQFIARLRKDVWK